jgi:hypothetical protein
MDVKLDSKEMLNVTDSKVINEILALSEELHAKFEILARLGPISEPVYFDSFRYDRMEKETGFIPKVVYKYHAAIKKIAHVEQELIGHEVAEGKGLFGLAIPDIVPLVEPVVKPEIEPKVQPQRKVNNPPDFGKWIVPALAVGGAIALGTLRLIILGIMTDPNSVCVVWDDEQVCHWWVQTCWWPK